MRNAIDSGFTAPRPRKPHLMPELNEVKVQTDRGGEFGGGQRRKPDHGFVHTIEARYGARRPNGYKGPGCRGIRRPDC